MEWNVELLWTLNPDGDFMCEWWKYEVKENGHAHVVFIASDLSSNNVVHLHEAGIARIE